MACPHVVGVAALVWSRDTSKSAQDIRRILQVTAQDLTSSGIGKNNIYGHGLVRADLAMEFILSDDTFPPTSAPTEKHSGYCNYRGCNGEIQGGEWCNEHPMRCRGECAGTWCKWNPTPVPTKSPTPPTSSPTRMPSPPTTTPTDRPSSEPSTQPIGMPTVGPSSEPSAHPSGEPSLSPSVQPTPCQDVDTDLFFLRMKPDGDAEQPVYKTCEWLVTSRNEEQRTRICSKNIDSHGGYGPARDVCRAACDTCYLTSEPSTVPTTSPTIAPSAAPSTAPTNAPTKSPVRSGTCCSQDFKTCSDSLPGWCDESENNCQQCGGIIITDAPRQCIAKWGECTWWVKGCCSPATCQGNQYYRQCLV